ncbi:uncharacterized protein A4U43_C01F2360 [Asparagus officinalis]|uniref:Uncharacterized protein n=1 Tax=Asparagus officinalis TaxID=4686 RepID=A0A5P1FQU8_ASPOF|nr:uncharacterized protein A4U43_C01F2360 [Asparagus officinalis]
MDSTRRLLNLIEQLHIYKPRQDEDDDIANGEDVGMDESAVARFEPLSARFRPKKAAVLICLFKNEPSSESSSLRDPPPSQLTLVFLADEMALPGGKAEEGDEDDKATALREAKGGDRIGSFSCLCCCCA